VYTGTLPASLTAAFASAFAFAFLAVIPEGNLLFGQQAYP
jgi:hypothetical protein